MNVRDETGQAGVIASAEPSAETQPAKILLLQEIGFSMLYEQDPQALCEMIMDAAVALMDSDFASMQMLHPERGKSGELQLLAFRGFDPQTARFWKWVRADSKCTCGIALATGKRTIEPDTANPSIVSGAHEETYIRAGIGAVQSTPLFTRDGRLVGMISTHWRRPHQPSEHDLNLLDILARHAAGLIERQQSDRAISRLAAIVETSDDAIVSKDLDGIITSWNSGAERLFGYTPQEVIGRPITILMPSREIDEVPGILARIRRGERIDHYETVRRRKDGTQIDISLSVSPIVDSKGMVVGASKIARDITERKRTEAALRELDRRKGEFLTVLSHELRNPLAPMLHAVTLLQLADDDQIRRQACAILERQIGNMSRLVEDLLDISRISRGVIEVRKEEIPLSAVIEAAIETSRPIVEAAGHQLEVALSAASVSVVADRLRLAQVVTNLINNAAKYTPRGGCIAVKVSTARDSAAISVHDNGIGIPAGDLPRIFDIFTRLNNSGYREYSGLGVGLALARQLMELHGGTIEARSAGLGQGSEFIVRIPVAPSGADAGASASA